MRRYLFPLACICLAVPRPAPAASLPAIKRQAAEGRCASDIVTMRGVWRSPEVFLPAFADWELVQYLASLGRAEGVAVLPVFSSEPACFRGNRIVFLSTGFIL